MTVKELKHTLKVFTAFSGYDSQCLAFDMLKAKHPEFDYELVGWSEIDSNAIKAHDLLFPQWADRNYGDISRIDWATVPDFDFFTYSSPCFPAGTKITTNFGQVPIEQIKEGSVVLSHDFKWHRVTRLMETPFDDMMADIDLCFIGKGYMIWLSLRCTFNHPLYARRKNQDGTFGEPEWKSPLSIMEDGSENWCIGYAYEKSYPKDYTDYYECLWLPTFNIKFSRAECPVYNLEVEDAHSYIADGVIVHNCQDFSNAGLQRGGEEGSGTRSSLLWECRKAILAKRPKYLLLENVKALVSRKFAPLFAKWMEELDGYGYTSYWQVLNAKDYGVPQNRERVFLLSIRNDCVSGAYAFPQKQELTTCLKDVLEPEVDDKYYLSEKSIEGFLAHNENHESKGTGFV